MKDIVVTEDLNPEVDKPGKRKKLDAGKAGSEEKDVAAVVDWDQESTPLTPAGGRHKTVTLPYWTN